MFYSHVVLGLVSLLYILVFYRIGAHSSKEITLFHELSVILFSLFILSLAAVISGWIDQKIHGQITVCIIGCITIAVMFNYNPKALALLYGSSCAVLMILLTISQGDPNIIQGNYITASLIVMISFFLSSLLYKLKQQDLLHKYYLEDLVTSTLPLIQSDAQNNDILLTVELNNVPDLLLDIQEIRQLLLNLVRNGFEAMSSGGQLKIRTFSTNSEVALVVSDEGNGIEQ